MSAERDDHPQPIEAHRRATQACLVVPCFNEQHRLTPDGLAALAADERVSLLLVDDGSTDSTLQLLHGIAADLPRAEVLALATNVGKGEAVRLGLRRALEISGDLVGYADADLATPPSELIRLIDVADERAVVEVVLGSRVNLIGRDIRRSPFRHYSGRVFATAASVVLGAPFYDTQCGAKLLRATAALDSALARPFRSRWAFDVELLGRLQRAGVPKDAFWEEPLLVWHDAADSHRSLRSSLRSAGELAPIWLDGRRR